MSRKEEYLNRKRNEVWDVDFSLGITDSGRENRKMQIPWTGLNLYISKNSKKASVAAAN